MNEGDELTVTLIFTPALSKDTSIRWYHASQGDEHANGAERNDYVYDESAGTRDIALTAGMTSATFTIETVEDSKIEGNETFLVHLCGPPPRCDWPYPPPEPHPSREMIIDWLESTEEDYQDVKEAPGLLVAIVDDDTGDDNTGEEGSSNMPGASDPRTEGRRAPVRPAARPKI